MLISLIVPCYNEEEAMPLFYQEAARVAAQMEKSHGAEFEIIFVDDGSKDGTLRVARELHDADPRVRYVSFSRNFGKEAGIYAGLKAAKGDYVATLDADLQDPPALLPDMLDALLTGDYDCAATRRTTREGEPPVRSWFARMFYRIINKMSDTEIVDGARDFRLMSRRMVDAVLEMSEYNRFSKGIFSWVGFKTKWFAYQNVERVAGQTKWNFWSLFKYSIEGIVGFSTQPLVMAALAGVIFCLAAFVGIIFVVVRALIFGDPTAGWPSMVCIMLLCSGVQLFCLGIVGEYLAKTYLEVKHRPIYITRETEQDTAEMSAMQDMTKGGAAGHLLRYAVPLMLGNWFQLAYNAVDSIIAGRFIGKDALAAEGIAGPVMNLVILGITGVCLGAGVLMSEFFGAKDGESLRRELATTVLSGTAACTVVALLGALFTPTILQACAVPREIFAITAIYLRITFLGAPFTCFYNALAAGFKSVGDARTPLRFLMVSAILNAALDLIFIGGLGFGIVCSAMTTVIAEAFSAVLAGWWLWTKTPELCPRRGQWRVDRSLLGRTLQYGGVSALQQAVQPIGKVLIQGQVNALGVEVIAAFNAVTRIDDFACIPEQSIAQGITTYIAQNRGAGRQDRIRRGFAVGLGMEAAYWMLIGGVVTLFKTPLAAMFVTGEGADRVIALAVQYLGTMALFYLLPAMTNGFQGYYRGIGNMPMTLLGTLIQTSLRVVTTCILAPRMGMYGIAFACATGWCAMLMVEVPFYFWQKARNE